MSELQEWYMDAIEVHDILSDQKQVKFQYDSSRSKKKKSQLKAVKNVKNYSKAVTLRIKGQAETPWQKTAADIMMLTAGAVVGLLATTVGAKQINPATVAAGSGKTSLAFYDLGNAFYDWLNE